MVGILVVVEGDGRSWGRRGHDLVRDAVSGIRPEVHVQAAVEADRGDHRGRVRGDRRARRSGRSRRCSPGRSGSRVRRARSARAGRASRRRCRGRAGCRCRAGRRWRGRDGRVAGGLARVRSGPVLDAVRPAVAVRVGDPRVGADPLLADVHEVVAVGALATVARSVAVAVDAARRRPGQEFERGPQAVAVVVLATVTRAVAIGVGAARVEPGDVFLPVGQPVAVGVLAPVGEAVAVRVGAGRAGQRVRALPGVRKAVVVGVGRGDRGGRRQQAGDERGRPGARSARDDDEGDPCPDRAADGHAPGMPRSSRAAGPRGPVPAGNAGDVEPFVRVRPSVGVKRPIRAPLEYRPCGRGWSNGHERATMSPSRNSSTSTATCATRSHIGSCAMRSGRRTPSSRHSSSPGVTSRGSAIRNASARGSIGCSSMPVTRSCVGIDAGAPASGSCRSTDRADPTRRSRSTTGTPSTAPSSA